MHPSNSLYVPRALPRPDPHRPVSLPHAVSPCITLVGTPKDATSPSLSKWVPGRSYRATTYMRLGTHTLNLSSEHEPGWPASLRLRDDLEYTCEAFLCEGKAKSFSDLPHEEKSDGGLVFYGIARVRPDTKDTADHRRRLRGHIAVWTDGLMLDTAPNEAFSLIPGRVYKVVVSYRSATPQ